MSVSWLQVEFGPAALWNQGVDWERDDTNWGLSLNLDLTVPLGDRLDLDLGAGSLVVMGDEGLGRKESMLSSLHLGLRLR